MARAIVRAPKLLLFDEPLSSHDADLRVRTRVEIKRLLRKFDITALYVTHDQVEAVALADKIVVMHAGKVEQIGAPLDLYDNPANLFVAGFIGSPAMNFLGGKLAQNGSGLAVVLGDGVRVPAPRSLRAEAAGRPGTVGGRPEPPPVRAARHARIVDGSL